MRYYFDTETFLIRPGHQASELVCVAWKNDKGERGVTHWTKALDLLHSIWESDEITNHTIAFDAIVSCNFDRSIELTRKVFRAYCEHRVICTQVSEELLDIRDGRFEGWYTPEGEKIKPTYSLAALTAKYLGRDLSAYKKKNSDSDPDPWRLKYGTLWDVPIEQWPHDAVTYPLDDVEHTHGVRMGQLARMDRANVVGIKGPLAHERQRAAIDFAHKLMSAWGVRTDPAYVSRLATATEATLAKLGAELGLYTDTAGRQWSFVRANGKRNTKEVKRFIETVEAERKAECDREAKPFEPLVVWTAGTTHPDGSQKSAPDISLSASALEDLAEEHPILGLYGQFGETRAILAKDVKTLLRGVALPIHSRYRQLVTDRTGTSDPNNQNWARVPGIRECHRPREGYVYLQADYNGLELSTLGTVCRAVVGWSKLADAIREGQDPHLVLAADFQGITYAEADARHKAKDKAIGESRDHAKPTNFGLPGGLGLKRFIEFSKFQYGVEMSNSQAATYRGKWFSRWEEMPHYFAWIRSLRKQVTERGRDYWVTEHVTGRVRGGCRYTAACNDPFQSLGASTTAHAGFLIALECYTMPESPLFGARPVFYVHDEFILEVLRKRLQAAAVRFRQILEDTARLYMPYCPPKAPPLAMLRWSKGAHEIYDSAGALIPWDVDVCSCPKCDRTREALSAY